MIRKKNNGTAGLFVCLAAMFIAGFYFKSDAQAQVTPPPCQTKRFPYEPKEAAPAALRAIKTITTAMGIENDFKVIGGKFLKRTPIAAAFMCHNQRYIIYDVEKYNWFENGVTNWLTLSILTHEIGHHGNNHLLVDNKPQRAQELEADYLAGFVAGRLGATLKEAYSFTNIFSEKGSRSHPPRKERKEIAIKGWQDAQQQKTWERQQCFRAEWSGDSFPLYGSVCRVVNFCSAGRIAPRVACHSGGKKWILQ